jgi:hypothetical protein
MNPSHLRSRQPAWTDEQTAQARILLEEGVDTETFLREIGRTKAAAVARLKYVDDPAGYRSRRCRPSRTTPNSTRIESSRFYIPDDVIEAAVRRAHANRSLTAIIFGDPAPGQSALDRRQSAEASA